MNSLCEAIRTIAAADALIISAGAGMGVDSGLPDYRGRHGFWNHYPLYRDLNIDYERITRPSAFLTDPSFAWGFYGHCLDLYRNTIPHTGFTAALSVALTKPRGYFVFTSNIDGQFHKAGFDPLRIHECHGSIHRLQCIHPCSRHTWPADDVDISVDLSSMRAIPPIPHCPLCASIARPNIFAFGDTRFIHEPYTEQAERFRVWRDSLKGSKIALIECGAGSNVPGIRRFGEQLIKEHPHATLIRINTDKDSAALPNVIVIGARAETVLNSIADGLK